MAPWSPLGVRMRDTDVGNYNPLHDFWKGWYEALAVVRERVKSGGATWEPGMSDKEVATVGRNLAEALADYAYTRKDDDKKKIAALSTELCRVVKHEKEEPQT